MTVWGVAGNEVASLDGRSRNESEARSDDAAGCFRGRGLGFRVQGSGFRVQGSGFRVQGSGFRVQGSGFKSHGNDADSLDGRSRNESEARSDHAAGCVRNWGLGFRV